MGAAPLMDLVRADMRGLNRRVRQAPTRSGAVTAREWDVMSLAALGRTDAEIAQALWLSRRTVTTHMHNVLKKLGLHSRFELAGWIDGHSRRSLVAESVN